VVVVRIDGRELRGTDLRSIRWRDLIADDREDIAYRHSEAQQDFERTGDLGMAGAHADIAAAMRQVDGRRRYADDHYRLIGKLYEQVRSSGVRRISQGVTDEYNRWAIGNGRETRPVTTVRNWIQMARKKGFISGQGS
jgi:hypothetical protein